MPGVRWIAGLEKPSVRRSLSVLCGATLIILVAYTTWRRADLLARISADSNHVIDQEFTSALCLHLHFQISSRALQLVSQSAPVKVVVIAEYRGGSSFMGEIFNQYGRAFYWFEPLAYHFQEYLRAEGKDEHFVYQHRNGSFREANKDLQDKFQEIMYDILSCNITHLDQHVMQHYFVRKWRKSVKLIPYQKCLDDDVTEARIRSCGTIPQAYCETSQVRVIKTIRYLVGMSEILLAKDPSIKFINYVRDPRGTTKSIMDLEGKNVNETSTNIRALCNRLYANHMEYERLKVKYPDNFYELRYEDLSASPKKEAADLYNFLGMELPRDIESWIRDNTNASNFKFGGLDTMNRNSAAISSRWHDGLTGDDLILITKHCTKALTAHHYTLE
ncbi:hypothetical protein CAPTEDRAFT_212615 [Capitella teleta]|uniref:Uncharacterized protein n=1 Tax=Capitella teleta TaxID=283909 RepID=R7U1A3_CAPTE|nr:hypothetical protein CAPTEDRAFT_212615 [Capitella teleta]|eukprot:ELT99993.1 hypothetical protein CAPTEDRAFT_212615 [Capitella teleta]